MKIRWMIATALIATVVGLVATPRARAQYLVLDFEPPLPGGLVRVSPAGQGASVPPESRITSQYASFGVVMDGVALVDLQSANPSGVNAIGGVSPDDTVDYGAPMTFRFATPGGDNANTDYFSITTDTSPLSVNGNTVELTAYDAADQVVGSLAFVENGVGGVVLELRDIGPFHRVVVDPTLHDTSSGGIGFDLVKFGPVAAVAQGQGWLPASATVLRCEEGLAKATAKLAGEVYRCHRRRVRAAVKAQAFDRNACEGFARDKFDASAARLFARNACPPCTISNSPLIAGRVQAALGEDNRLLYCDGTVQLP